MTLFTKEDCILCHQLKKRFDLLAMDVRVEVLGNNDAGPLAHLAWHGLVEAARKALPILVLDDSTAVQDFEQIEHLLLERAARFGRNYDHPAAEEPLPGCQPGCCAL